MIKLAVSSCLMHPDIANNLWTQTTRLCGKRHGTMASSDVMPVLMPDLDGDILARYMDEMDGLVLQGGADLARET